MDKLSKAREEICKDCMFGIAIENCRACLYNLFQEMDKHSPFSSNNGKLDADKEQHQR